MKQIQIANCNISVIVDEEDFERLNQYRWLIYARKSGYEYAVAQVNGRRAYMHRLLCGVPGRFVDHINGNTLDNRKSNLRAVSAGDNSRNQHCAPSSNTGVRNVHHQKSGYVARVNGKYLGCFQLLHEAEAAVRFYRQSGASVQLLLKECARLEAENADLRARAA